MKTTIVFKKNLAAYTSGVRRIVNKGGTSSTKTFSILQLLIEIARRKENYAISVVSESLPHLKKGTIKDFEKILRADGIWNEEHYNRSDQRYYFGSSYIEFFSADQPGKATGLRRDILYLNEVNNMAYQVVEQLEIRTADCIFYDFNPVADFWITDKIFTLPAKEFVLIKSNYLDGLSVLPANVVKDIELKASLDANFKKVHIDVEFGESEGLILTDWSLCDTMPLTDRHAHGLDFGFSNDPTTLMQVKLQDGQLWINELLYETGLTNPEIARFVKDEMLQNEEIIADSSEPKSIEELRRMGLKVKGAEKAPGSVNAGIDWMKRYHINITKRSVNTIREFRNYKWKVDMNGEIQNTPVDLWNHCIDPVRYTGDVLNKRKAQTKMAY